MTEGQYNLLTPKQVARALGVSEASLKRWCDRGLLPAMRTAGGHRRLPLDGVIEFIRSSKRPMVRPEVLGLPPTSGQTGVVIDRAVERFYDALVEGDETRVRSIVFDLHLAGHTLDAIADRLISPTFVTIGARWADQTLDVYQERRACELCLRAVQQLSSMIPTPDEGAPLALGGTLSDDWYMLPTALCELTLRQLGWTANSLGTNIPAESMINAMHKYNPRLAWISVSYVDDEDTFVDNCTQVFRAAEDMGIAVVCGGRDLNPQLRDRISYTSYCESLGRLVPFAKALHPGTAESQLA